MDYFNISKDRWQKLLNITKVNIPDKLIIEGNINYPKVLELRGNRLSNMRDSWMPNLKIGEFEKQTIGYGVCFGGPTTSQYVHIYSKMGTKKIVHIGICGGLQKDMELGDIIVSEGVLSLDGIAKLYKHDSDFIEFDNNLKENVILKLRNRKMKHHVGKTVTYYDILLEEGADLINLSKSGYLSVEMEAAAVAAVAKYFDVPAISICVVADNSISGKDLFYNQTKEEQKRIKEGMNTIFNIALII